MGYLEQRKRLYYVCVEVGMSCKRFKKVVTQDWHVVPINRANLWKWSQTLDPYEEIGDTIHYLEIRQWCAKTFPKKSWEGRLLSAPWWKDTSDCVITKEFAFKNEKDKTLFVLKWS